MFQDASPEREKAIPLCNQNTLLTSRKVNAFVRFAVHIQTFPLVTLISFINLFWYRIQITHCYHSFVSGPVPVVCRRASLICWARDRLAGGTGAHLSCGWLWEAILVGGKINHTLDLFDGCIRMYPDKIMPFSVLHVRWFNIRSSILLDDTNLFISLAEQ